MKRYQNCYSQELTAAVIVCIKSCANSDQSTHYHEREGFMNYYPLLMTYDYWRTDSEFEDVVLGRSTTLQGWLHTQEYRGRTS